MGNKDSYHYTCQHLIILRRIDKFNKKCLCFASEGTIALFMRDVSIFTIVFGSTKANRVIATDSYN